MADNADRKSNIAGHVERNPIISQDSPLEPNVASTERIRFFNIEAENELCILVGRNCNVEIELLSGQAEIYGAEMELNKVYSLKPYSSIGVFSWSGCGTRVSGTPDRIYFTNVTSMMLNLNIHAFLEERRLKAEIENKKGPIALVVGQNDLSKKALCQLLLNYAVRMGRHPLFLDIDVGQNSLTMPGSIGVLTVEKTADIVNGFDDQPIKIYHYGYRSAWEKIIQYTLLLQRLNLYVQSDLMQNNQNDKTSGVIIQGCDWSKFEIRNHRYGIVSLTVDIFKVDVVCVIDEESSYSQLKRELPENIEVLFIPNLNKVDKRVSVDKSYYREARMKEYFYGPSNQPRQPFTFEVKYSDIQVFKIAQKKQVKRHTQFLGEVKQNYVDHRKVGIPDKLMDQILALSSAENVETDIMYKPVTGFICVTGVDVDRGVITVLSPFPGPLSTNILLRGDTRINKYQPSKKSRIKDENKQDKVKKEKRINNRRLQRRVRKKNAKKKHRREQKEVYKF